MSRSFQARRLVPFKYQNDDRIHYRAYFEVPRFDERGVTITDGVTTVTGDIGYRVTGDPNVIEVSIAPNVLPEGSE